MYWTYTFFFILMISVPIILHSEDILAQPIQSSFNQVWFFFFCIFVQTFKQRWLLLGIWHESQLLKSTDFEALNSSAASLFPALSLHIWNNLWEPQISIHKIDALNQPNTYTINNVQMLNTQGLSHIRPSLSIYSLLSIVLHSLLLIPTQ